MREEKRHFLVDYRGFSLIELIIVVSIMAVLTGVLVPMYLRYVENSYVAADIDTLDKIHKAFELEYALGGYNEETLLTDVFGQSPTNNLKDIQYKGECILLLNDRTNKVKLDTHPGGSAFAPGNYIYDSLAAAGIDVATLSSGGEIKLFKSKAMQRVCKMTNKHLMLSIDTDDTVRIWIGSQGYEANQGGGRHSHSTGSLPDSRFYIGGTPVVR